MKKLIAGVKAIVGFFELIIKLVKMLVEGIYDLLKMIPQAMSMLIKAVEYLPAELVVFALATVSIMIIYLIVGRGHSD